MKTFKVTIAVFVQADHATEAMDILGAEMDYLCGLDNPILAVEYPQQMKLWRCPMNSPNSRKQRRSFMSVLGNVLGTNTKEESKMTTYTQEHIIHLAQQCWPSDRRMWAVDANLPGLLRFVELAAPSTSQPMWTADQVLKRCQECFEEGQKAAPSTSPVPEMSELLGKFEAALGNKTALHSEYQGKAMPDDVYAAFANLRDVRVPELRAQILAQMAAPSTSLEMDALRAELESVWKLSEKSEEDNSALRTELDALKAAPSTSPITDERIDAAVDVWFEAGGRQHTDYNTRMRAALAAAIKGGE